MEIFLFEKQLVSTIRGVAIWEKNLFSVDFPNFKQLNHAFKGPIKEPPGTAQASIVQTRTDAAQTPVVRHLQEQYTPL